MYVCVCICIHVIILIYSSLLFVVLMCDIPSFFFKKNIHHCFYNVCALSLSLLTSIFKKGLDMIASDTDMRSYQPTYHVVFILTLSITRKPDVIMSIIIIHRRRHHHLLLLLFHPTTVHSIMKIMELLMVKHLLMN
jgi:hypothetical protein